MADAAIPVRVVVLPSQEGLRIDQLLAAATDLSRRSARRLIAEGAVLRNQVPARVLSRTVVAGDVVDLLGAHDDVTVRTPLPGPAPTLLHHDRWLLVADKPAGVLSQPAEGNTELAFDQLLLLHLASSEGRRPFLRLVHRLDRLTSGAVLCARDPQALPPLASAWSGGTVDRRYLAVVEGRPPFDSLEVDRPIARDRHHAWRFEVSDRGQPARTSLRVLHRVAEDLALVECRLITGRTHQVRVHLAAVGHPVAGDRLYGSSQASRFPRPLLHAAALALPHPGTGRVLRVVSPLPTDLAEAVGGQGQARARESLELVSGGG